MPLCLCVETTCRRACFCLNQIPEPDDDFARARVVLHCEAHAFAARVLEFVACGDEAEALDTAAVYAHD